MSDCYLEWQPKLTAGYGIIINDNIISIYKFIDGQNTTVVVDEINKTIQINASGGSGENVFNDTEDTKTITRVVELTGKVGFNDRFVDVVGNSNIIAGVIFDDSKNYYSLNRNIYSDTANKQFGSLVPATVDEHLVPLGQLNSKLALKQNINDNALNTTNKTIVGAINELKNETDSAFISIQNLSDNKENNLVNTDGTIIINRGSSLTNIAVGVSSNANNLITKNIISGEEGLYVDGSIKQDTLVSGTNIKTINGNTLLGSGNLNVTTDLSNYYTMPEVDGLLNNKQNLFTLGQALIFSGAELNIEIDMQTLDKSTNILKVKIDPASTLDYSVSNDGIKLNAADLSDYYTQSQTNTQISNALIPYSTTTQMNIALALKQNAFTVGSGLVLETGNILSSYWVRSIGGIIGIRTDLTPPVSFTKFSASLGGTPSIYSDIATPISANDAVNKQYVDNAISGITLLTPINNISSKDVLTFSTNQLILSPRYTWVSVGTSTNARTWTYTLVSGRYYRVKYNWSASGTISSYLYSQPFLWGGSTLIIDSIQTTVGVLLTLLPEVLRLTANSGNIQISVFSVGTVTNNGNIVGLEETLGIL